MTPLPPLRFRPILKERVWGGRGLAGWGKPLAPSGAIGESWEISDRPGDQSVVAEGPLAGATLGDLVRTRGAELVGRPGSDAFPLLVKLLDAKDWLSIQVHPLPETARPGEASKTEAWVVLEAAPNAAILLGLAPGRDLAALAGPDPASALARYPVKAGDVVVVPAGTVHAIGPGILLAEIQQNADTTYRLHDWGRGSRALQAEAAMSTLRRAEVRPSPPRALPEGASVRCGPFALSLHRLASPQGDRRFTGGESWRVAGVLAGDLTVRWPGGASVAPRGTWWIIPAALSDCTFHGHGLLLEATP